jgi:DNA-binding NtrC family response regulator
LRERREDIPLLACHLLARARERTGKDVGRFSEDALRLLGAFAWPGNVRQLDATIERAVIACDGDVIEPRHLPRTITHAPTPADVPVPQTNREFLSLKKRIREQAVSDLEREFVLDALQRNDWNVTHAAAEVGIQRPNFQMLMRRHGIRTAHSTDGLNSPVAGPEELRTIRRPRRPQPLTLE